MSVSIKISEENYMWLHKVAGELQAEKGGRVSVDKALSHVRQKRQNMLKFAGAWGNSAAEAKRVKHDIRKGWKSWKMPSV